MHNPYPFSLKTNHKSLFHQEACIQSKPCIQKTISKVAQWRGQLDNLILPFRQALESRFYEQKFKHLQYGKR